eukprot:NODE_24524_length_621_cov_3.259109.p3 GENE.NODE_24524_length_621_cov_3.259109~~NODE_24524_length_621_cov_3.259109.p3  ORF type:complete len:98 (+),score=7.39 NODE_24524_length_621_cov_3.259109:168-461(+)
MASPRVCVALPRLHRNSQRASLPSHRYSEGTSLLGLSSRFLGVAFNASSASPCDARYSLGPPGSIPLACVWQQPRALRALVRRLRRRGATAHVCVIP